MLWAALTEWVMARLLKVGLVTLGVSVFVGSCVMRDHTQQAKGAAKAVAKIEKANDHATKLGKRAADRSTAAGVRGQRDPTSRDD